MSEFRISHVCGRSSGSNLLNQYRMLEEYMTKHLGKNIIINEVSALEESQRKEIEELRTIIERAGEIKNNWENCEFQEATHYTWLDDENRRVEQENFNLKIEIQKRDAEIERLKKFCSEFVYGEENPEYYSTMDEKIQKRDELLEQAREWITVGEIDCTLAMQVWFKQYEEMKR